LELFSWGLGIGDWGLGIGDWANPQLYHFYLIYIFDILNILKKKLI